MSNAAYSTAETVSRAFLDSLPQMFCRFHYTGRGICMDAVSAAVTELTGRPPEMFVADGLNWLSLVHPSDRGVLPEAMGHSAADSFSVEYRIYLADGSVRNVRHVGRRLADRAGMWAGCIEDITAMCQTRQELERTQMLQNLGRLVAGIAHEINTPIQFIGDNLHFLAEAWEAMALQLRLCGDGIAKDEPVSLSGAGDLGFILTEAPDAIRQSLEGVERISGLVAAMRDFSHIDERRMAPADLNRAIRSTLTLLRNELKYIADVRFDADTQLPEVHCSVDDISRVLLNLLINAGHSIKEKIENGLMKRGVIEVSTCYLQDRVEIAVRDNGMGIPHAIQHRIFERFFTTKRNQAVQGTGQGLAMVQAIVEQRHNGRIRFETKEGTGTTFFVCLPMTQESERTAP